MWRTVKDDYSFAGTRVTFDISRRRSETIVHMAHTGFKGKPDFDFAFMSTKWETFMRDVYVMHQDF